MDSNGRPHEGASPMKSATIKIGPLALGRLPEADRIFRLAFGTFIGLPDPLQFSGDADYVRSRWRADPSAVLGAELDGELVGSNFVTNWGSFGFFGPLTIRPDLWNQGIAQRLLESTMALFELWGTKHRGLFTFSNSPKHVALYQKFGFSPRSLTVLMEKPVPAGLHSEGWSRMSAIPSKERSAAIENCSQVTDRIYKGLNVEREIRAVIDQRLGDIILLDFNNTPEGFAVCHCGPGTEAGSGNCYIKFAAVSPGAGALQNFLRLLDACAAFASERGIIKLSAGVNEGRQEAYRRMNEYGFSTWRQGLAMETGDPTSGYNHPGVFVLDDWR
jgi:GNAT superfamily N-acetyltransferase